MKNVIDLFNYGRSLSFPDPKTKIYVSMSKTAREIKE